MTETPKVGEIVDYEVQGSTDPALHNGATLPLLVVNVDGDGTYSGVVFTTDGTTRYVHVAAATEQDTEDAADAEAEAIRNMGNMTPDERASLRAELAKYDVPADPAPAPASDQGKTPADSSQTPAAGSSPSPSPDPAPASNGSQDPNSPDFGITHPNNPTGSESQ